MKTSREIAIEAFCGCACAFPYKDCDSCQEKTLEEVENIISRLGK